MLSSVAPVGRARRVRGGRVAYKDEPNWVSGRIGRLTLEPPITHPAFCPCSQCPAYREKRAARLGLPLAQVIAEPIDIRVKRNSPYPRNRSLSKEAALRMKEAEEKRLNELAAGVQAEQVAKTNAVPFRKVVDHYRNYMIDHKKGTSTSATASTKSRRSSARIATSPPSTTISIRRCSTSTKT